MNRDAIPSAALDDLDAIYREVRDAIASAGPVCELSGVCCDFETAGHVLLSTDLEVAYARRSLDAPVPEAPAVSCPFLRQNRCHLRGGRPLGCRVYYCDDSFAERMPEIAEEYHRRVVALHEVHGIPYRYRPFIETIRRPDPENEE